jgi:hypothetical protein
MLRMLYGSEARRPHRPGGDQCLRLPAVDLRPGALRRARREALQPSNISAPHLLQKAEIRRELWSRLSHE